jgi:hypothetical protein
MPLRALAKAVAQGEAGFEVLYSLLLDLRTVRAAAAASASADTQQRAHVFELSHHACLLVVSAGSQPPDLLGCSCEARAFLLAELVALAAWLLRYAQGRAFGWLPSSEPTAACGGELPPAVLHAVLQATTTAVLALHTVAWGASPEATDNVESALYGLTRLLLACPGEPGEPRARADAACALLQPQADALGAPLPGLAAALRVCTAALSVRWEEASGARMAALGCTLLLGLCRTPEAVLGAETLSPPLAAAYVDAELAGLARPVLLLSAEALGICWEGRAGGGCPDAAATLLLGAGRVCRALLRVRETRAVMTDALLRRAGALLGGDSFDSLCGFGPDAAPPLDSTYQCINRVVLGLAAATLPLEQAATLASLLALLVGADGQQAGELLAACPSLAFAERNLSALLAVAAHEARGEHLPQLYALLGELRRHNLMSGGSDHALAH